MQTFVFVGAASRIWDSDGGNRGARRWSRAGRPLGVDGE
jgi:hypothetical protein